MFLMNVCCAAGNHGTFIIIIISDSLYTLSRLFPCCILYRVFFAGSACVIIIITEQEKKSLLFLFGIFVSTSKSRENKSNRSRRCFFLFLNWQYPIYCFPFENIISLNVLKKKQSQSTLGGSEERFAEKLMLHNSLSCCVVFSLKIH